MRILLLNYEFPPVGGGGGVDSAFGVQFGKKISRFTAGVAVVFMLLAIGLGIWANRPEEIRSDDKPPPAGGQLTPDKGTGAGESKQGTAE